MTDIVKPNEYSTEHHVVSRLDYLHAELRRLQADPPHLNEAPHESGEKLIKLWKVVSALADELIGVNKRR